MVTVYVFRAVLPNSKAICICNFVQTQIQDPFIHYCILWKRVITGSEPYQVYPRFMWDPQLISHKSTVFSTLFWRSFSNEPNIKNLLLKKFLYWLCINSLLVFNLEITFNGFMSLWNIEMKYRNIDVANLFITW